MGRVFCCLLMLPCLVSTAPAQTLPLIEDVSWLTVRVHIEQLLKALEELLKAPLPAEDDRKLRDLLAVKAPADPDAAVAAIQKVVDTHCLVGVNINPESRVKAARGSATVALRQAQETLVLLKVHNEAGVTHALTVTGPQIVEEGQPADGRWLLATVAAPAPLSRKLSGQRLEYVLLRLTPREAGKREATLKFDVGQGTQDLGFRAEVPILFTVRTGNRD